MRRLPLILMGLFVLGLSPFFFGMVMERHLTDVINREFANVGFDAGFGPPPDVQEVGRTIAAGYRNGTRVLVDAGGETYIYDIEVRKLGDLRLTSGSLVASDPLFAYAYGALDLSLPTGKFPVLVSVAYDPASRSSTVALAKLRLSDVKAVRWEPARSKLAIPEGFEDLGGFGALDSYLSGYLSSGNGSFMDADAARTIEVNEEFADRLQGALDDSYNDTITWANVVANQRTGANVIAFSSGFGAGYYYTYAGYSASGKLVAVVTDFGVLEGMR